MKVIGLDLCAVDPVLCHGDPSLLLSFKGPSREGLSNPEHLSFFMKVVWRALGWELGDVGSRSSSDSLGKSLEHVSLHFPVKSGS